MEHKDFNYPFFVILEHANLEVAQTKKGVELINCE